MFVYVVEWFVCFVVCFVVGCCVLIFGRFMCLFGCSKPLEVLRKYGPRLYIGKVAGGAGAGAASAGSAATDKKVVVPVSKAEHHAGAPFKVASTHQGATATAADQGFKVGKLTPSMFGEQIPV